MIIPLWLRRFDALAAASALIVGLVVAVHYARLDLTLSHYDARGHLVVARRIFDNLTPGWWQIGAIWLPLPHLLNALPVQVDAFYRSGLSAVLLSSVAFALAGGALARLVLALSGSVPAAILATLVFALNPNVLYLQATPMTEPLLLGLMLMAVALLAEWTATGAREAADWHPGAATPRTIGILFALACLTRYEAWPVTASALAIAAGVEWRRGQAVHRLREISRMTVWPAGAILAFMTLSRILVGEWFVASGFYVPDNPARGRPLAVLTSIATGVIELSGTGLSVLGACGVLALLVSGLAVKGRRHALVPLALVTTAALPFSAFLAGHPYRGRYMVPLIAAQALGVGMLPGIWKRAAWPLIVLGALVASIELSPLDGHAPMVVEAQWDRPSALERRAVTDCLRRDWDGEVILASMGSLGHYMQELSQAGFALHDFIHEGNGEIWRRAIHHARPYAGWVLISEREDNRDALAAPVRENASVLDGFERVCEGGLVALYRRVG